MSQPMTSDEKEQLADLEEESMAEVDAGFLKGLLLLTKFPKCYNRIIGACRNGFVSR